MREELAVRVRAGLGLGLAELRHICKMQSVDFEAALKMIGRGVPPVDRIRRWSGTLDDLIERDTRPLGSYLQGILVH